MQGENPDPSARPREAEPQPSPAWHAAFARALAFFTRLPVDVPEGARTAPLASCALGFAPAGAAIGLIVGLVNLAGHGLSLPPLVAALAALAAGLWLTGALHEDGLADTVDGFGGGRDRERRLAIMRDSRIGGYGTLALILSVGSRAACLAALPPLPALAALVAAHALSRAALAAPLGWMAPARGDGLGAEAGSLRETAAGPCLALGVAIALAAAWVGIGFAGGLFAIAAAALAAALVMRLARRAIGGYTGDVLGTVQQATEIAMLVVFAAIAGKP